MRVAVTGASGLLGRAVIHHAPRYSLLATPFSRSGVERNGSVCWDADMPWTASARLLDGFDAVIHAAAYIPTEPANPDIAAKCLAVNAIGTLSLLRAAREAGVRRFVFVSGANTLSPKGSEITEDEPLGCLYSPYYLGSKAIGELYVRAAISSGMNALVVRPSSIYGPGMTRGMFVAFADALRAGRRLTVLNGGCFWADYVWRDDVAAVLCAAVLSAHTGTVNLGSGVRHSSLDVAGLLADAVGADRQLIEVKGEATPTGFSAVDISRARDWFRFEPVPLAVGLSRWFGDAAS